MLSGLGALAVVGLLAWGVLHPATNRKIDNDLQQGRPSPAPAFRLETLTEGRIPPQLAHARASLAAATASTKSLRGTPIVLNFWASWCDPCRLEAPILEAGWQRDGPNGVLYLGVNTQDLTGDATSFIERYGVTYPSLRDPANDTAKAYGAVGLPETYFIDSAGEVVGHVIGQVSSADLSAGVQAARRSRVQGVAIAGER